MSHVYTFTPLDDWRKSGKKERKKKKKTAFGNAKKSHNGSEGLYFFSLHVVDICK
jgi:hypothetical protein